MSVQKLGLEILQVVVGFLRLVYWHIEVIFRLFVPPPLKSIDGEVILVTGAAGGIGKEICRYIVQCGVNINLVLWDLHLADLEKLAEELKSLRGASGLKVYPFAVDISCKENIDVGCRQIKDEVGSVTIIFNNAGIAPAGNLLQLTNEQIENTIQVNLMSHLWIIRQFLPEMVTNNHGRIVNICSVAGLMGGSLAVPYFASKFAVNGYTEALRMELSHLYKYDGIHLSTVYPYFVQTPLIQSLAVDSKKGAALPGFSRRFLKPEEVARKAVDGMRREYEYIYCPPIIPLIVLLNFVIPSKVRKACESKYVNSFVYKDAEQHNRLFNTPYAASISTRNGNAKKD